MVQSPRAPGTGVRVSMSCLAEFVSFPNRSLQSRLRPFKFNRRGEGFARTTYYQPALKAIRAYHAGNNDGRILDRQILELDGRARTARNNRERIRLERSIGAIEAYRNLYGGRRFRVLPNRRMVYPMGGINVTAQPDLWVEENQTQVLLKLGTARHTRTYIDMLLSLLRKAAVKNGYRIRARNIVYLNIATGQELVSAGSLTRFNRIFATGAREIATAWPGITPGDDPNSVAGAGAAP
jgi:hypothetical protein